MKIEKYYCVIANIWKIMKHEEDKEVITLKHEKYIKSSACSNQYATDKKAQTEWMKLKYEVNL